MVFAVFAEVPEQCCHQAQGLAGERGEVVFVGACWAQAG
jgi:hypothetical protein